MDPSAPFRRFLLQRLRDDGEGQSGDAGGRLAALAQSIQTTVWQVGELFLPPPAAAAPATSCLMQVKK